MKKRLLLFWTLASLLILLAMVFGLVLPWPFQEQDMAQATGAWLNGYSYRTPVTITGASAAGGNYTIGPMIVYRGTATTLENGSWTVNGTAYTSRFSFTVEERSGSNLTNYAIKVPLDTQSLVEGGYFNAAANGDEVEFTTSGGTVLNYWLDTTAFGAPDCVYYIKSGLTASSTSSFYCYLNPAVSGTSTSFGLANTFPSISVYTAASSDDCIYYSTGDVNFSVTDARAIVGSNGNRLISFTTEMRWQVNIPQYSDIISATLGITCKAGGGTADCATLIKAEQYDSAAAYSTWQDFWERLHYTKTIAWNITGAWITDIEYTSGDIRALIQDVINRNGWIANNYLSLGWYDNTLPAVGAYRYGYSYDGTAVSTQRPHLTIYYRAPVSVAPLVSVPVLRANAVQALSNTVNWPNDIRVTASDGTTELPFYLDTKYENYVKLHIKDTVDDLSTGNSATIYVYYGKDGATSGANIASTFSFGDDFTGTRLDTTTNWTQTNTVGYGSAIAYDSMWLRPRYPAQRYVGIHDRTYITWVNNAGELKILAYDHTQKCYIGGIYGTTIATGWFSDLYDSATILVIPSGADAGKILVFAERSDTTTSAAYYCTPYPTNKGYGIYVYKSDLAEDISSWSLKTIVEPDSYALYPQPIVLSTGNIALFYSVPVGGPYIDACYVISTDAGDTWGARTILIRGDGEGTGTNTWIFPCVLQGGKETHVFFHTWNSTSWYVSLGYLYNDNDLDPARWMKRNGTSCGNLTAAGFTHSVTDRLTSGRKPYVTDMALDSSNNPYVAFVTYHGGTLTLSCKWAYYSTGVGWVIQTPGVGRELDGFQAEMYDPYSTGISIDPKDPTHIFMGVRTDTSTDIQELHTTDNGLTWTKVADITSGSVDLCSQPYCVRNYSDDLKLLFNVNMAFTDQQHWASYLSAYPLSVNKFHSVVLRGKASSNGIINSKNTLSGHYTFVSQVLQISAAPGNNTWFAGRASTGNYNDTVARIYGDAATNYQEVVQSTRTGQTTQTQNGLNLKTGFYQDWKIKWLGQDDAIVSIDGINRFTITTCTGNSSYITMVEGAKANTYTFVDYIFAMPAVPYEPTWTVGSQEVQGLPPTPTPTPSPSATPTPGSAQSTRHLPVSPQSPGQTFDVSLTFTAPSDNFNSIGLADNVPEGWTIQANTTWCTPNASSKNLVGNQVEYVWFGPYSSGQTFTALYRVTVPGNVSLPSYTFTGQLNYKIGGGSRIFETIAGDSTLQIASGTPVNGITRQVNGNILPGVSITLDGIAPAVSGQDGQYEILAAATGNHTVIAHRDGFRDRTQSISIAGLGQGFAVTCNFQGQSGLIPKAPDMWYALDCVNLWLYPPNPDIGLDMWTALDVINAWLYPVQ